MWLLGNRETWRKREERVMAKVTSWSPALAAHIDLVEPWKRSGCGGPLNGQIGRQTLVRALFSTVTFDAVIETGTYRGTTTDFLWRVSHKPVFSVENQPRYFYYARRRLAGKSSIRLALSDSRAFLASLAEDHSVPRERLFFYLDAHWEEDLPLADELMLIWSHWRRSLILIDDFQVPHDPGYGFDDYGPIGRLATDYLPLDRMPGAAVLFPTFPSLDETGARRGCAVVVCREQANQLVEQLPLQY
jgi:hypothetical protein